VLHILNGDAIKQTFAESGISGEVVIWRMMLCEGPTSYEVASPEFWQKRKTYMRKDYDLDPAEYERKTIHEIEKIRSATTDEYVLWFEFDMFCQINMLAAIQLITTCHPGKPVSLVCPDPREDEGIAITLGHLTADQFKSEFQNRPTLSSEDIRMALQAWQAYNSPDHSDFEPCDSEDGAIKHLKPAWASHLARFPRSDVWLSEYEMDVLRSISKFEKPVQEREILTHLLMTHERLGYGDLQWSHLIDRLGSYLSSKGPLSLNEDGQALVRGQSCALTPDDVAFGGAFTRNFIRDPESGRLTHA
jgi:hypothetical protein